MWSRVAGIAGKGVHKAVEAASYVGEVAHLITPIKVPLPSIAEALRCCLALASLSKPFSLRIKNVIAPDASHDFEIEEEEEEDASPAAPESAFTKPREASRFKHEPPKQPGATTAAVRIWEDDDVVTPSGIGWGEAGGLPIGTGQEFGSPIEEPSRRAPETLSTEATRGDESSKASSEVRYLVGDSSRADEGGEDEPVLKFMAWEASSESGRRLRGSEGDEPQNSQPSSVYDAAGDNDGADYEVDNFVSFVDENAGHGLGSRKYSDRMPDSGGELGERPRKGGGVNGTEHDVQMGPVDIDVIASVVEDAGEPPLELHASMAPSSGPSNQELQEHVRRLTRELEEASRREVESVEETRRALSRELEESRSRAAETVENMHRGLSQELEEVRSQEAKVVEENRRLTHVNAQLKQIIDQMRKVSRSHSEETKLFSEELGDAVKAKEAAEHEATMAGRQVSELQELLEQALHRTDRQSFSAQEKDLVMQELKQTQQEATEARLRAQESEQELSAKLVSLQAMYQTALQQQQQLRSRENALTADLALAVQDKARLESALGNMRGLLEEFGAEKHTEVKIVEARLREEMAAQAQEFETAKMKLNRMHEEELSTCKQAAEEAFQAERRLRVRAEVETARVSRDVQRSRGALDDALTKLQGNEDGNVDRQFVKNLIVRYVTSRHKKQVLDLMARMFSFTEEDKELVGLSRRSLPSIPGMLTAMFTPSQEELKIPAEDVAGRPLSDLWMDFLMSETAEEDDEPK